MGKVVKRIVLTGGPCAGKSTSLELIENYLKNRNYIVYTVQESATELINSGIKPFGEQKIDLIKFQEIILKYQLDKEILVDNIAKKLETDKEIVIIYDRAIIDNKAFIGQKEFDKLLKKAKLNEIDILDKYDLVIHLETAAKGSGYTKENNKARNENNEEAIDLDNKAFDAWKFHKNLVRVKSYEDFSEKQKEIIRIIENNLYKKIRKQNKYLVRSFDYKFDDEELFYINQHYLNINDEYEHRLRSQKYKNKIYYYYTIQKKNENGISEIIEDKRISESKFNKLLSNNIIKNEIKKIRKYLIFDDKKYSIDIFHDGKILLEGVDENIDYKKFNIINDVTNDKNYLNQNL